MGLYLLEIFSAYTSGKSSNAGHVEGFFSMVYVIICSFCTVSLFTSEIYTVRHYLYFGFLDIYNRYIHYFADSCHYFVW